MIDKEWKIKDDYIVVRFLGLLLIAKCCGLVGYGVAHKLRGVFPSHAAFGLITFNVIVNFFSSEVVIRTDEGREMRMRMRRKCCGSRGNTASPNIFNASFFPDFVAGSERCQPNLRSPILDLRT